MLVVCFGSKKRRLLHKFKGNFALSIARNLVQTGCSVRHAKSPGRPCVSGVTVEQLRKSFVRSPRKSTRRASRETGIPNVTV